MFARKPKDKLAIPFTQKLITLGIIVFFAYIYFTQFQNEQLKKQQLLQQTRANQIHIKNLVTNEVIHIDPATPGKTTIVIKRSVLEKLKEGDISLLEIEVPEIKKPEAPVEKTPSSN